MAIFYVQTGRLSLQLLDVQFASLLLHTLTNLSYRPLPCANVALRASNCTIVLPWDGTSSPKGEKQVKVQRCVGNLCQSFRPRSRWD